MSAVCVLGLDVSTVTGATVLQEQIGSPKVLHASELVAPPKIVGLDRASYIAEGMLNLIDKYQPKLIVTEGYAFGNAFTLATLVEVGTILRYFARQRGFTPIVVAPAAVKKFVLGKGVGKKSMILLGVFKKWGYEAATDNIADAYVLSCVGLGLLGKLGTLTVPQKDVLRTLE